MKVTLISLVIMLLMSTVLCRPRAPFSVGVRNTRPYFVVTNSRTGTREVHLVHDPDDIDDVVEASARRFVDPHGVLDEDAVEDLIDPHDTLDDSIKRVVDPQEWAEDQREDKFERLQVSGHNSQAVSSEDALEAAEDAAERQEEEREEMYEAMEEALERHLDPTGTKGIDVEFAQTNGRRTNFAFGGVVHHPIPRPTLHHQRVVPRPVLAQPATVPVPIPITSIAAAPKNIETSAPAVAAISTTEKQEDSQQETIKEFQGEVKDIADDVAKSAQPIKNNESNGSTEKSSNGKKP